MSAKKATQQQKLQAIFKENHQLMGLTEVRLARY